MSDLTARLDHFEQIAAIRRPKHSVYCDGIDRLVAGDTSARAALSAHLADDVVADWTGRELMSGKAKVETFFFEEVPATLSFSQHRVLNEIIDIDGDVAIASWYLDCPAVFRLGNVRKLEGSALLLGRYQEQYVRENGVWKWRKITYRAARRRADVGARLGDGGEARGESVMAGRAAERSQAVRPDVHRRCTDGRAIGVSDRSSPDQQSTRPGIPRTNRAVPVRGSRRCRHVQSQRRCVAAQ